MGIFPTVCSRQTIERDYKSFKKDYYSIISIRGHNDTLAKIKKTKFIKDILFVQFDDIEYDVENIDNKSNLIPFTENIAEQIVQFIKNAVNNNHYIICHCEAGISRSAGVAAAIAKHYSNDDTYYFTKYIPNRRVYKLILEQFQQ